MKYVIFSIDAVIYETLCESLQHYLTNECLAHFLTLHFTSLDFSYLKFPLT